MSRVVFFWCLLASAQAESCTRWQTFGSAAGSTGINSATGLLNSGWTSTANVINSASYVTSPDFMTFYCSGGCTGSIENDIPPGHDFVRVRYGNWWDAQRNTGTTELQVGNVIVGSANVQDNIDVTMDADYADGDKIKISEMGTTVANIYSIDLCKNEAGSCFHGDGTVLLESGSKKRLSELGLGERIKTSDGRGGFSFNPVLTLPHANNTEPATFLTLTTETGKKVDMTSDHYIPKCNQEQVTAGELVIGDCLLTADGKETLVEISSAAKNGVFTAVTQDMFVVVDGIVASSFSKVPTL